MNSIENKIVLVSLDRKGTGRGGAGEYFVYALLDWDAPQRQRRQQYLDGGGNPNLRATAERLRQLLLAQSGVRTRSQGPPL